MLEFPIFILHFTLSLRSKTVAYPAPPPHVLQKLSKCEFNDAFLSPRLGDLPIYIFIQQKSWKIFNTNFTPSQRWMTYFLLLKVNWKNKIVTYLNIYTSYLACLFVVNLKIQKQEPPPPLNRWTAVYLYPTSLLNIS